MTLDLAAIPADLLEPTSDHTGEPANDPTGELEPEPTPLPASSPSPPPQEIAVLQKTPEAAATSYPNDHFIHALYGGFMGMPDLPGALLRANLWDSFVDDYTNPDLRHHFAHIVFPAA